MATHSSFLAWRIPGTAEPGGLPSVGSHRVRLKRLSSSKERHVWSRPEKGLEDVGSGELNQGAKRRGRAQRNLWGVCCVVQGEGENVRVHQVNAAEMKRLCKLREIVLYALK